MFLGQQWWWGELDALCSAMATIIYCVTKESDFVSQQMWIRTTLALTSIILPDVVQSRHCVHLLLTSPNNYLHWGLV